MKLRDLSLSSPVWVTPNTTIEDAARSMSERSVAFMPVIEDHRPVGVVTDRDLAMAIVLRARNAHSTRVCEIMSKPVFSVSLDAEGEEATRLMIDNNVRRLVVHDRGTFVGVVSLVDLAGQMPDANVTDAVHQIAEHNHPLGGADPTKTYPELYIG